MKKSFWVAIIVGFLSFVLTAYGLMAFMLTRGLNVYLLSYKTGKFLVSTYLPFLIIGGIGWVITIVLLVLNRKKKEQAAPVLTAQPTASAVDALANPASMPQAPAAEMAPETAKETLSAPVVAMEVNETASADGDETILDEDATILEEPEITQAEPVTESVPEEVPPVSETTTEEVTTEEEAAAEEAVTEEATTEEAPAEEPVKMQAPAPKFCTKCGTPLQEGFLFCMECGEKIS